MRKSKFTKTEKLEALAKWDASIDLWKIGAMSTLMILIPVV